MAIAGSYAPKQTPRIGQDIPDPRDSNFIYHIAILALFKIRILHVFFSPG